MLRMKYRLPVFHGEKLNVIITIIKVGNKTVFKLITQIYVFIKD